MSEYQHYEFRALDRRLTLEEMEELRQVSTRGEISSTRYFNFYSFSDFKGDPDLWMERHFDAFLYFANWGTRTLKLRLYGDVLSKDEIDAFSNEETVWIDQIPGGVIINFHADWEEPIELDQEPDLDQLLPLRDEIAGGDHRSLYLAWLTGAQTCDLDVIQSSPRIPPGLNDLTDAQEALVDFLGIDSDLLDRVSQKSSSLPTAKEREVLINAWISSLEMCEKDDILRSILRILEMGNRTDLYALKRRFNDSLSR